MTEATRVEAVELAARMSAEADDAEPELCAQQVYDETYDPPQPAEMCEEPAVEGSEFCVGHGGGR